MNESHECDMYYYCYSNSDNDNEKDYCDITECPYMKLKRKYDKLIQNRKDLQEFIKECESDYG